MQTRKHTRVKDTREDHSRGALASKRYTRGPLARSTCERTLHARTTRSYSTRASRTRGSAASGTLHLGGTVYVYSDIVSQTVIFFKNLEVVDNLPYVRTYRQNSLCKMTSTRSQGKLRLSSKLVLIKFVQGYDDYYGHAQHYCPSHYPLSWH